MINFVMNILWLFLGGWSVAVSWFFASLLMFISIIGIPWARAAFNIGLLNLWPFGSKVVDRKTDDLGTGPFGIIGNIIWFLLAGLWLALFHLAWALIFTVTIIGFPFALQHWKLAKISLAPIGKRIEI